MGTVLSLSPGSRKAAAHTTDELLSHQAAEAGGEEQVKNGKKKKRHPVLLHVLSWKKRVLAARAKRKGGKKVKPAVSEPGHVPRHEASTHYRSGAGKIEHRNGAITEPVPSVHEQKPILSPRRVVVQASTGELLRCLSDFVCRRCVKLKQLTSNQIIIWFRNVDRALLIQGWQDQCFISPAALVFVYLLCREAVDQDTSSEQELHATFLTCLYLAYSYLGNEISYPLKPFLVESCRDVFWERALDLIEHLSEDMLRINLEADFFTEVFQDLKSQSVDRDVERGGHKLDKERQKGDKNMDNDKETDDRSEDLDR